VDAVIFFTVIIIIIIILIQTQGIMNKLFSHTHTHSCSLKMKRKTGIWQTAMVQ